MFEYECQFASSSFEPGAQNAYAGFQNSHNFGAVQLKLLLVFPENRQQLPRNIQEFCIKKSSSRDGPKLSTWPARERAHVVHIESRR